MPMCRVSSIDSVCAGFYLEDVIEMTQFKPTHHDRKRKKKEAEGESVVKDVRKWIQRFVWGGGRRA